MTLLNETEQLRRRVAVLLNRVSEMEDALKPFADLKTNSNIFPDRYALSGWTFHNQPLTIGHCRRAAEVLGRGEP